MLLSGRVPVGSGPVKLASEDVKLPIGCAGFWIEEVKLRIGRVELVNEQVKLVRESVESSTESLGRWSERVSSRAAVHMF